MKEIWKDIKGLDGYYQVSNLGRVKSLSYLQKHSSTVKLFRRKERMIKLRVGVAYNGYTNVMMSVNGKQKSYYLHRVIAEAFIPNPDNKPFINHKNGIKTDNRIENLEWVTRSENALHACNTGLQKSLKGSSHPMRKLSDSDIHHMRNLYNDGYSTYAIWKDVYPCVSYTNVKDIIAKRTWQHI